MTSRRITHRCVFALLDTPGLYSLKLRRKQTLSNERGKQNKITRDVAAPARARQRLSSATSLAVSTTEVATQHHRGQRFPSRCLFSPGLCFLHQAGFFPRPANPEKRTRSSKGKAQSVTALIAGIITK